MRRIPLNKAHRLLAPRLVALLGSRLDDGRGHLIPITNLTSLCTRPQTIVVSVYDEWDTCSNLRAAAGFTLSIPRAVDASLVWRLGAKYSGYDRVATKPPDVEFRDELDESFSPYGPVLHTATSWLECHTVQVIEEIGDHVIFIAAIAAAMTRSDGRWRPLMQWSGPDFSDGGEVFSLKYFNRD